MSRATHQARFASLDHFRGFAALWVLLFHVSADWLQAGSLIVPHAMASFLSNGWRGVQVFFVLSGYCIAQRLATDLAVGRTLRSFLIDRTWRVFPPYWAALLFAVALNVIAVPFNRTPLVTTDAGVGAIPDFEGWLRALTLTEPFTGGSPYLLVSWTLTYELIFYALAAGCVLVARLAGNPAYAFAAAIAIALVSCVPGIPAAALLGGWLQFVLGALVWLGLNPATPRPTPSRNALVLAVLIALAGASLLAGNTHTWAAAATALALYLAFSVDATLSQARALRWLSRVGVFSYSLYLVHVPVAGKARNLLGRWFEWTSLAPLVPALSALLAVAIAWLFFRSIEIPSEVLRKSRLRRAALTPRPAL